MFCFMGDDHLCNMEGIGTIQIMMFDGMVQELKEVRYVPQVKKILSLLVPWKHWVMEFLLEMVFSR